MLKKMRSEEGKKVQAQEEAREGFWAHQAQFELETVSYEGV